MKCVKLMLLHMKISKFKFLFFFSLPRLQSFPILWQHPSQPFLGRLPCNAAPFVALILLMTTQMTADAQIMIIFPFLCNAIRARSGTIPLPLTSYPHPRRSPSRLITDTDLFNSYRFCSIFFLVWMIVTCRCCWQQLVPIPHRACHWLANNLIGWFRKQSFRYLLPQIA